MSSDMAISPDEIDYCINYVMKPPKINVKQQAAFDYLSETEWKTHIGYSAMLHEQGALDQIVAMGLAVKRMNGNIEEIRRRTPKEIAEYFINKNK